ncbi:MAG TPA: IS21 family transposase [Planctomycetota bacterium]|nr:IS21 family transposase [Planctomycetota bacterium]
MQSVERWAELRRLHFVKGISIKELQRRTGLHRQTIRRALRSSDPPRYERERVPSKLDPFKDEIHHLLREDPRLPNTRLRELITPLGYVGAQTILDAYLREVRPLFLPAARTYQRTEYRPGAIAQFDLWQPRSEVPVGFGQTRRAYVVVGALGYSRVGAGALIFSKEVPDLLWGMARCLRSFGGLPETLVWDREGALHAGEGKPSDPYAAFLGQLKVGWHFCAPGDAEAKGLVERLQQFLETSFEPGRHFAGPLDLQEQLDRWFERRANVRLHRALRERPVDRLAQERSALRPLPEHSPDVHRRFVLRVPPQPYARFDTNDYSLEPRLAGRRVEIVATQRRIRGRALETGELACDHERLFARHRTLTALEHARALRELRGEPAEVEVERRPLSAYDRLIPA